MVTEATFLCQVLYATLIVGLRRAIPAVGKEPETE